MDIFGRQFNQTQIMSGVTSTNTNYGGKKIAGSKVNIYLERMAKLHIVESCGSIPKIVDFLDRLLLLYHSPESNRRYVYIKYYPAIIYVLAVCITYCIRIVTLTV